MTCFISDGTELVRTHIQGPKVYADGDQYPSDDLSDEGNWVKFKYSDGTRGEVRLNHIRDYQRFAAQPA